MVSKFVGKFNNDFYEDVSESSEDVILEKRLRRENSPKNYKIRKNEELLKKLRQEDMKYGE
jgi:hypothetical protein